MTAYQDSSDSECIRNMSLLIFSQSYFLVKMILHQMVLLGRGDDMTLLNGGKKQESAHICDIL